VIASVRRNLRFAIVLAACATVIIVSTLYRAEAQAELGRIVRENCAAIEDLKAQFRQQAIQNYLRLEENARLLDIPLTPELRQAAEQGRDRTLRRFAKSEC
jgi:hypothetical protein